MISKFPVKNAEELLQILNRVKTLTNELEETLLCIKSLNCVDKNPDDELLDTSVGSVTDSVLKEFTSKLQSALETLS